MKVQTHLLCLPPFWNGWPYSLVAHNLSHLVKAWIGIHKLKIGLRVLLADTVHRAHGPAAKLPQDETEAVKREEFFVLKTIQLQSSFSVFLS
jgi:hypothetical protein